MKIVCNRPIKEKGVLIMDDMSIDWTSFVVGQSELECESIEDAKLLMEICIRSYVDCKYVACADWEEEPYWYIKNNELIITKYTLEEENICDCWTVKDYIENHYRENNDIEKENNILKRYSDNELLLYSLSLLNISKEELVEMYKKNESDISLEKYSDDKVVKWIKNHNEYFKNVKR